jgi:putative flippase GtrA
MIRHFFTTQFLLFVFVGITAAFMNWAARFVFNMWMSFPVAVLLAYGIGMASAFELNRRFVFPASPRPLHKQARVFVLTNLAFLPVVWGASIYLKSLLSEFGVMRYSEGIAHGLALTIPVLITFLVYKFIAFGSK